VDTLAALPIRCASLKLSPLASKLASRSMPAIDADAMQQHSTAKHADPEPLGRIRLARRRELSKGKGLRRWRSVDSELPVRQKTGGLPGGEAHSAEQHLSQRTPKVARKRSNSDPNTRKRPECPILYPPPGARDPVSGAQDIDQLTHTAQRTVYQKKIELQTKWVSQMDEHLTQLRSDVQSTRKTQLKEAAQRKEERQRLLEAKAKRAQEKMQKEEEQEIASAAAAVEAGTLAAMGGSQPTVFINDRCSTASRVGAMQLLHADNAVTPVTTAAGATAKQQLTDAELAFASLSPTVPSSYPIATA
jgi:hypothetical protein